MSKSILENLNIILPEGNMPRIYIVPKGHKPNYKLMSYVIQLITLNPYHWDQRSWRCGTSFCFAGWVDFLAAYQHDLNSVKSWSNYCKQDFESVTSSLLTSKYYEKKIKELKGSSFILTVASSAQLFLGISDYARVRLFRPTNSIEDLRNKVNDIKEHSFYWL